MRDDQCPKCGDDPHCFCHLFYGRKKINMDRVTRSSSDEDKKAYLIGAGWAETEHGGWIHGKYTPTYSGEELQLPFHEAFNAQYVRDGYPVEDWIINRNG